MLEALDVCVCARHQRGSWGGLQVLSESDDGTMCLALHRHCMESDAAAAADTRCTCVQHPECSLLLRLIGGEHRATARILVGKTGMHGSLLHKRICSSEDVGGLCTVM